MSILILIKFLVKIRENELKTHKSLGMLAEVKGCCDMKDLSKEIDLLSC